MARIKICSILMLILFVSCNPEQMMMPSMADDYEMQQNQVNTLLYNENGQLLLDFIPVIQPFVNEACNTAWLLPITSG